MAIAGWRDAKGAVFLEKGACEASIAPQKPPSRSGGIGRRDGFKIRCPKGCEGSSPSSGILVCEPVGTTGAA